MWGRATPAPLDWGTLHTHGHYEKLEDCCADGHYDIGQNSEDERCSWLMAEDFRKAGAIVIARALPSRHRRHHLKGKQAGGFFLPQERQRLHLKGKQHSCNGGKDGKRRGHNRSRQDKNCRARTTASTTGTPKGSQGVPRRSHGQNDVLQAPAARSHVPVLSRAVDFDRARAGEQRPVRPGFLRAARRRPEHHGPGVQVAQPRDVRGQG